MLSLLPDFRHTVTSREQPVDQRPADVTGSARDHDGSQNLRRQTRPTISQTAILLHAKINFTWKNARHLTKRNVRGAPALVIEILSPNSSARDKRSKRALYERVGVREYWVVDPGNDCISVHRLERPGRFHFPETLTAANADSLTTPLLPGLALDLKKLFR